MTNRNAPRACAALIALCALLVVRDAAATTKGLSQIVTPDLQPEGQLSLSVQGQARRIANPYELQGELGLNHWLEVAAFQGLSPGEQLLGTEIGLIQQQHWLLGTGFVNWSTQGDSPQPFLEAGYYTEHDKFIAGSIRVGNHNEVLLGWAHDFNPRWRFQLDYQGGSDNYATVGFTCNVTERFQFNPALYVANDGTHSLVGYIVLTYTLPLWQGP